MKFSILIPTWNNLPYLKICIESIEKNSKYQHEILIHINDGTDGTLEWVKEHGYRFTHSDNNIGICFALNRLRSLVSTEYIVFINDDMYMCPLWDEVFANEIKAIGKKEFFLASITIQPKPHNPRPIGVVAKDFGYGPDDFREQDLLIESERMYVPDTHGCIYPPNIVHRDLWDLVGGYSVEYSPGMGSDPDFSAKLYLAGVRYFKTLGESRCYHFMSRSVNRVVKNNGNLQFLRKWQLTSRAFRQQWLHLDTLWDNPTKLNEKSMKLSRIVCKMKRIFTCWQDAKAPTL